MRMSLRGLLPLKSAENGMTSTYPSETFAFISQSRAPSNYSFLRVASREIHTRFYLNFWPSRLLSMIFLGCKTVFIKYRELDKSVGSLQSYIISESMKMPWKNWMQNFLLQTMEISSQLPLTEISTKVSHFWCQIYNYSCRARGTNLPINRALFQPKDLWDLKAIFPEPETFLQVKELCSIIQISTRMLSKLGSRRRKWAKTNSSLKNVWGQNYKRKCFLYGIIPGQFAFFPTTLPVWV